MIILILRAK
jgi:ketosteroid isomerase-like protein